MFSTLDRLIAAWRPASASFPCIRATVLAVWIAAGAAAPLVILQPASGQPGDRPLAGRPNVVLIMADDMGFSDIGCYGGEVHTPNLDRLALEGMRFTQFYNNAKCTTTRASLLTGKYPRRRGALLTQDRVTLGEVLRRAGYQTALFGKWHLGAGPNTHPLRRGFDEYYGLLDGCCNYFNPKQRDPKFKGGRIRRFANNDVEVTQFPPDYYTTDAFTDRAVDAITRFAATERPFFVHLCYTAPHYPLHAKPQDIAKYRGHFLHGWESMRRDRYQRLLARGIIRPQWELSATDSQSYDWATANREWEDLRMSVYAAMIDCMDQNIGRVLQALDESGVRERTLVLFLSDNGGCAEEPGGRNERATPGRREDYTAVGPAWGWAQNSPFRRYKSWVNEGGISTPLIARWPSTIRPYAMTDQVGHLIDIMPTLLELAGGEYPKTLGGHSILPCDGISLVPVLNGWTRQPHETLFWEWAGNRAARQGRWKAVWDKRIRRWQLFDMDDDRTETRDLAARRPLRTRQLVALWNAWDARR